MLLDELEEKIEEARQKAVGENQLLEKAQIAKSGGTVKEEPKDSPGSLVPDSAQGSISLLWLNTLQFLLKIL